ncbi:MAG: alpha/beta fold hydrolase [Clostridiaceae bacterium]|mgnify:CR=1 FL=1|jgi:pimeloyl-ACP methyl ester carboxylesterase|nr:alpha/beta fold hydrolase [Clostridiaceae bacterium]
MKKNYPKQMCLILVCLVVFIAIEIPTGFFKAKFSLMFSPDDSVIVSYRMFPEQFKTFCADGVSSMLLNISLYDSQNTPVSYSLIKIETNNFSAEIKPRYPITDKNGRAVIRLSPKPPQIDIFDETNPKDISVSITITAKKSVPAVWNGYLSIPPVLLIHGFQDTSESFVPMKNYLENKGARVFLMDYEASGDFETMANILEHTLNTVKSELKQKGVLANKTNIVAHSLGGLIARYYTCRRSYIKKQDVNKMIFINVPHHGTPWAEAGAELLDSPFLKELYPTSALYTSVFPDSINMGLNHTIQVANIALDNDEVVPLPSSSLDLWGINTKTYHIGEDPLDIRSLAKEPFSGETRHRQILFFIPVFEEVWRYLVNDLPYPSKK